MSAAHARETVAPPSDGDLDLSVTITVKVDPEWIEFLTKYSDIFGSPYYAGYWLFGVERDDALGWLAYEHGDDRRPSDRECKRVVALWRAGEPLPERWFRLDRAAAIKAWGEAVKRYGVDWYEKADGAVYDVAVQMALLGEVRYG